jgi:hypothetical protein
VSTGWKGEAAVPTEPAGFVAHVSSGMTTTAGAGVVEFTVAVDFSELTGLAADGRQCRALCELAVAVGVFGSSREVGAPDAVGYPVDHLLGAVAC